MKTFYVETLGCKVNQYESEQLVTMLRARGLSPASAGDADLRIVNSCSVTSQAASQSRQATRRLVRLGLPKSTEGRDSRADLCQESGAIQACESEAAASSNTEINSNSDKRVVVVGCWATSDTDAARSLAGVDAVLTHHHDLAAEFDRLLKQWITAPPATPIQTTVPLANTLPANLLPPGAVTQIQVKGENSSAGRVTGENKPKNDEKVNEIPASLYAETPPSTRGEIPILTRGEIAVSSRGARGLPLLGDRQASRQRAFVKIQDGCDAHCTYCIIPNLRPTLWSKPVEQVVDEASRLVDAGHVEIVLTGIFLGAYGQETALHRRQDAGRDSLAKLIERLSAITGLRRLRLSSIEPGDLTPDLLTAMAANPQIVPHFHLPLQSGSDLILRKMNRQYGRDDFQAMVGRINAAFDRPALTTDIIVGFPGEDDAEFEQTFDIAQRSKFIHIHAFPYSPRPGTAAARWNEQFIHGPIVGQRIARLTQLAAELSLDYRRAMIGKSATVIVERGHVQHEGHSYQHGRTERYFPVLIVDDASFVPGDELKVQIDRVDGSHTFGTVAAQVPA